MSVDNPLKWLLARLPDYVPAERLDELLAAFEVNKAAYYRQVKIRALERTIKYRRSMAALSAKSKLRLQALEAQLARLKEEEVAIGPQLPDD